MQPRGQRRRSWITGSSAPRIFTQEDDPEHERYHNLWRQQRLIPPYHALIHGLPLRRWSHTLMLLATYELIYIPMQLAFQEPRHVHDAALPGAEAVFCLPNGQIALQYLIDLCFLLDIMIRFRTMYISNDEYHTNELVTSPQEIARHYLRRSLGVDILACLPTDLLFGAAAASGGICSLSAQGLRLNRLLHLTRLYTVHSREIATLGRVRRLLFAWTMFGLLAHCIACSWWAIGHAEFNARDITGFHPWIHPSRLSTASSASSSLHPTNSSFAMRYSTCLYWAITTLIKVPWLQPLSTAEQIFAAIVTMAGAVFFAFIIGETTAIANAGIKREMQRTDLTASLSRMQHKVRALCGCLRSTYANLHLCSSQMPTAHRHVPWTVQIPAIYYWEACQWIRANAEFSALWAKKESLSMLPYNLRNEAQLWLHKDVLGPSAFAHSTTEVCLHANVVRNLRSALAHATCHVYACVIHFPRLLVDPMRASTLLLCVYSPLLLRSRCASDLEPTWRARPLYSRASTTRRSTF